MSDHTCDKYDEDCWRCDLNRDEVESAKRDMRIEAEALRDAANDLDELQTPSNDHYAFRDPALWLNERANEIDPDVTTTPEPTAPEDHTADEEHADV